MYQFQLLPTPNDPPEMLSVAVLPVHIADGDEFAPVDPMDDVCTMTVTLTQVVVLHVFSALAQ